MAMTQAQRGFIAPQMDDDSRWWWEGVEAETLLIPECESCGNSTFPPGPSCPFCGSTSFLRRIASGRGSIYSWVTIHLALDEAFNEDVPYTIVAVTLEEGPRIFGRLVGSDDSLAADAAVTATYYRVDGVVFVGFELR
jgi:uncharacterized OB-fold protein